jgi:hypothetical protein
VFTSYIIKRPPLIKRRRTNVHPAFVDVTESAVFRYDHATYRILRHVHISAMLRTPGRVALCCSMHLLSL